MRRVLSLGLLALLLAPLAIAQPLAVETYTLPNGFTVMLNPDPTATEVSGAVMVKAGGKNDPADATGIAHYLEHLLFKGTQDMGTSNYEAEKVHLDRIVELYDEAAQTTDPEAREALFAEINKEAVAASEYGLPNEFDKLLKSLGGTGINAFTSNDITFYYNNFPAHELPRWLDLYSHRFENPVFRSFQSELEVVYEEKNRSMDAFQSRLIEQFSAEVFKGHPYGEQLVLGTIEHLKNPSLTKMYEFFNTNYVANNMALILSGNFDPTSAKPIIAEKFGDWRTGEVPEYPDYPKRTFDRKEELNVRLTPIPVSLLGFKTVNDTHPDRFGLDVVAALLSNSASSGFLDEISLEGKVLQAGMFNNTMQDDGVSIVIVVPKPVVQSFRAAEKLVMASIDKVKDGEFSEEDLAAVKSTLYKDFQSSLENIDNRAVQMGFCFSRGLSWDEYLKYPEMVASITREDVMRLAEQYYGDNYFAMYSKTGFPKKEELEKPSYKPVTTDQNAESDYAKAFQAMEPSLPEASFVDFAKDITRMELEGGNNLYWTENLINDVFTLDIEFQVGTRTLPSLEPIADVLNLAGTGEYSATELKRQFASLGASFFFSSNRNYFTLSIDGIEENLAPTLALVNDLLQNTTIPQDAIKTTAEGIETNRKVESSTPDAMGGVLFQYGLRGEASQYLTRYSLDKIEDLDAKALAEEAKAIFAKYGASLHYVGTTDASQVVSMINSGLTLSTENVRIAPADGEVKPITETTIYLLHDPKAVQSQVYYSVVGQPFDTEDLSAARAFNSYYGGGFSGLVLQEIREYRSLAYSAGGSLDFTGYSEEEPTQLVSFTGSQADKTTDAVTVMLDMIQELPEKPDRMPSQLSYLKQSALTSRPGFRGLSQSIEGWELVGFTQDPNGLAFAGYDALEFTDIVALHEKYVKDRPILVTIYGDKDKMDLEKLGQLGTIIEVEADQVMVK